MQRSETFEALSTSYLSMPKKLPVVVESEDAPVEPRCPERLLLGAVLERAVYDLMPWSAPKVREAAIAWFTETNYDSVDYKMEVGISFNLINEELQLSAKRLKYIKDLLIKAQTFTGRINYDAQPPEQFIIKRRGRRAR